jgi:hypothetical protein
MPPQRITTDSRSAARWAGTHADLKAGNDSLSDCFKGMRQQEQSEWAAANPLPQELSAGASKVEEMTAEHLRMVREIRRLTKDDRFTGSCCLELANRPMEVMDDLEEVLPSVTRDRIKYVHMRRKYLRDDIWTDVPHFCSVISRHLPGHPSASSKARRDRASSSPRRSRIRRALSNQAW